MRQLSSTSSDGFSIAEAFTLLSLAVPKDSGSLAGWSDVDFALAGAHLMDLSFQDRIDSDVDTVFAIQQSDLEDGALPLALKVLNRLGGKTTLSVMLNEVVGRIGELRSETLASLVIKKALKVRSQKIFWGFVQSETVDRKVADVARIRNALVRLIETDELPDPEQAALISLLHACGMIGAVFGGVHPDKWLSRYEKRVDAIRRIDLVGRAVAGALVVMRKRLSTYLLESGEASKSAMMPAKKKSASVSRPAYVRSKTTWEWRAFWPAVDAVEIPLSLGHIKDNVDRTGEKNLDVYLFVYGKRDNIKFRGKGLKIKPIVEAFDEFSAFAPSEKIAFPAKASVLSTVFPRFNEIQAKLGSREELLAALSATGYRPSVIEVVKTRREYPGVFGVHVELASIWVDQKKFYSISLESRYLTALRVLARGIPIGNGIVGGYGEFLERIVLNGAGRAAAHER